MVFPGFSGGSPALDQRSDSCIDGTLYFSKFTIKIMQLNANNSIRVYVRQNGVFNLITGEFKRKLRPVF